MLNRLRLSNLVRLLAALAVIASLDGLGGATVLLPRAFADGADGADDETGKKAKKTKKKAAPKKQAAGSKKKADPPAKGEQEKDKDAASASLDGLDVSPELKKKIDDLLREPADAKQQPKKPRVRGGRKSPPKKKSKPSRAKRKRGASLTNAKAPAKPDPTTSIHILPTATDVPPEDRMYNFSIKDGTYAQLIEGIARQTGLGVLGDAPRDGKVSFVTEEELTFDDMLNRVRMLLFKYKPLEPYWLQRKDTHLEVIRVTDLYRDLPTVRMFKSMDLFAEAKLPEHELALVVYTPKSGSVADLNILRDFMPDYVRIAPMEGRNSITIFARVSDIHKYLELKSIFIPDEDDLDPRTLELIDVLYIPASVALEKLQSLMELDGVKRSTRVIPKRGGRDAGMLQGISAPETSIVADDAQGKLIVRAMPGKIKEIKKLLPLFDVDMAHDYTPVVIEIKHAEPGELIATVRQVLESGVSALDKVSGAKPKSKSRRVSARKKAASASAGRAIGSNGITLLEHPTIPAVIVLASEEDLPRVRNLVALFDVEVGKNNVRIELSHRSASEVSGTVTELMTPADKKRGGLDFQLVEDPSDTALWFSGSKKDLENVRTIIAALDTEVDPVSLHIVTLENQKPSFVADILEQYEGSGSGGKSFGAKKPRRKPGKSKPRIGGGAPNKFMPEDDQGRLFILCTDAEWDIYRPLIDELEAVLPRREIAILTVEHIAPSEAMEKLKSLAGVGGGPTGKKGSSSGSVRMEPTEDGILVLGATSAQLDQFRMLLKEFDRPVEIVQRTFEILHADPGELREAIEALISDEPSAVGTKRSSKRTVSIAKPASSTNGVTIVQVGSRLVVKAPPEKMEKVAALIAEFDVVDGARVVQVYEDFAPGMDLVAMAETLAEMMGTAKGGPKIRPKGKSIGSEGPQFIPQTGSRKLIVLAEKGEFERIEKYLSILRAQGPTLPDVVVAFLEVEHGDAVELVELIDPLLTMKVRRLIDAGELVVASAKPMGAGAKLIKARQPGLGGAGAAGMDGVYEMFADERNKRIVIAGAQRVIEEARQLVAAFDQPSNEPQVEIVFVDIEFADPGELVEEVAPLLDMKLPGLLGEGPSGARGGKKPLSAASKVRRMAGQKSGGGAAYHLEPDLRNSRIAIAARPVIIAEAIKLIKEYDRPSDDDPDVFRTVRLENAESAEMVKAIREMQGKPVGRGKAKGKPTLAQLRGGGGGKSLSVVEAPGGGAIVLHGARSRVDEAEEWIKTLDGISAPGRVFKVYEIQRADVSQLMDLIIHLVDTSPKIPTRKAPPKPRPKPSGAFDAFLDDDEPEIVTSKLHVGKDLYIHADLVDRSMIVAASPTKMAEVDNIVEQFDGGKVKKGLKPSVVPKKMFELQYADAFDAMYTLRDVLETLWDPSDNIPTVDYANFGDEEVLIVKYTDRTRFDEVGRLIEQYVDRFDPSKTRLVKKSFVPPKGLSVAEMALWFKMNHPEYDIELIDVSASDDQTHGIEQVRPLNPDQLPRCVLPLSLVKITEAVLAGMAVQTDATKQNEAKTPKQKKAASSDDMLRAVGQKMLDKKPIADPPGDSEKEPKKSTPDRRPRLKPGESKKLRISINKDDGVITVEGPLEDVAKVDDWMEELEEEVDDLPVKPDIRIYRVRYIDVYSAQEIIEEMFNATKAQRQRQQSAVRRQQQQQRQAQQRQQQQARAGQQAQPGQQPKPGQRPPAAGIPKLPDTAVRIYPNPRDRTLILRADSSQFPALLELLATIDQPKPVESDHRIYQLKKLNATEVEELLTDWLGLESASKRAPKAGAARPGVQRPRTASQAGGNLPKTIMQQTSTGPLGVDPKDIKLTSNEASNTILAMAPAVALDYIGEIIAELESSDMPDRIWTSYVLKYADVAEVAAYLESRFGEGGSTSKGVKGRASSKPTGLHNAATFVSYPRLNMLSVQATQEQTDEINALVAELDVAQPDEEFVSVTLLHADAKVVADTLEAMFGKSGGARTGRSAEPAATGPKFIGDEGGRMLFYSAPDYLKERINTVIKELEIQFELKEQLRVIVLEHAKPSMIAEAIERAFTPKARGGRGGGAGPQVTVTASDPAKRLFVMTDEATHEQIASLVTSMDKPLDIGFDFRIYPFQHASARQFHSTMTSLVKDYIKQLPRDMPMEAFSVEVDDKANALIVLGSQMVFTFVEETLKAIDTPANAASPQTVYLVALRAADAKQVAQNITQLWSRKEEGQEDPPMAQANEATNTLVIRGTQEQIDEIKREIIGPLEENPTQALLTETIVLKHAQAADVAELLISIFEDRKAALKEGGRKAPSARPLDSSVAITPDVNTNQIIVQATADNLAMIKQKVKEMDDPAVAVLTKTTTKVYPVNRADLDAVVTMLREWGKSRSKDGGGKKRGQAARGGEAVLAVAEPATKSVVVTTSEANHILISSLLGELDEGEGRQPMVRSFQLLHADLGSVHEAVNKLFKSGSRSPLDVVTAHAEWGTNSLIVSASAINMKRVEELIKNIDSEDIGQQEVHVINLVNTDAPSVAQTLDNIFVKSAARPQGGQAPPITVSALTGSKAVLIKCKADVFERIEAVVAELDKEDAVVGEAVTLVTLLYTDATEIEGAMVEYLKKPGSKDELVGDTRISVLTQSNAMVLSGQQEKVDRLEGLIRELDAENKEGTVPQIIPLKHAKAGQIVPVLREMFTEQKGASRKGQSPPVIVSDDTLNTIIVRAGATDRTAIETIIAKLDTPEAADKPNFKLVQVGQGINVRTLAETVEQAINDSARQQDARSGSRETRSITITPDARTSTLVVAGSPSLFGEAEQLAKQLEAKGPAGGRVTRVLRQPKNVKLDEIQRLIEQLTDQSAGGGRGGRGGRGTRATKSRGSTSKRPKAPSRSRARSR